MGDGVSASQWRKRGWLEARVDSPESSTDCIGKKNVTFFDR